MFIFIFPNLEKHKFHYIATFWQTKKVMTENAIQTRDKLSQQTHCWLRRVFKHQHQAMLID